MTSEVGRTVSRIHDRWQRSQSGATSDGAMCDSVEADELTMRAERLRSFGSAFAQVRVSRFISSGNLTMAGCSGGGVAREG